MIVLESMASLMSLAIYFIEIISLDLVFTPFSMIIFYTITPFRKNSVIVDTFANLRGRFENHLTANGRLGFLI